MDIFCFILFEQVCTLATEIIEDIFIEIPEILRYLSLMGHFKIGTAYIDE